MALVAKGIKAMFANLSWVISNEFQSNRNNFGSHVCCLKQPLLDQSQGEYIQLGNVWLAFEIKRHGKHVKSYFL